LIAEGGFNQESVQAIAGIPVFSYNTNSSDTTFFSKMLAAD